MSDLPQFQQRKTFQVLPIIQGVFSGHLLRLEPFEDGHFRAVFRPDYFVMQGDATEPTKSQWSSLKKRIKRRDHRIFVFKEYGTVLCQADAETADSTKQCFYIDFGFLKDLY